MIHTWYIPAARKTTNLIGRFATPIFSTNTRVQTPSSDTSMGRPRRPLSNVTIFVVCSPLVLLVLDKIGSETRPRGGGVISGGIQYRIYTIPPFTRFYSCLGAFLQTRGRGKNTTNGFILHALTARHLLRTRAYNTRVRVHSSSRVAILSSSKTPISLRREKVPVLVRCGIIQEYVVQDNTPHPLARSSKLVFYAERRQSWKVLDEIFPEQRFRLCGPPSLLEKIGSKIRPSRGCVTCVTRYLKNM